MKGSRRLRPVARFARQQERDAARQLGDRLHHVEQQQKQLDNLLHYRDQYVANFQSAGQQGLSAVQLRDYQLFLSRLDGAILQQRKLLAESRRQCEQSQAEWRHRHGHSKMIDKVVETRKAAEHREQNAREQREQDDRPMTSNHQDSSDS